MKYVGKYVVVVGLISTMWACSGEEARVPEPHLELGQRISFVGGDADRTYIVAGYRHYLEDKTDKNWQDHAYIVFSYMNDQGDIKVAAIHRNAVLKR